MKYPSIEKYIAEHNLSLREFARQCDMPSSTICQLLKGDTEPSKSTIDKILAVIGLSYEVCFREKTMTDLSNFDIDSYNKYFFETTKGYKRICGGKPCEYADNGCLHSVFCNRDDEKRELHYIPGCIGDHIFSFKDMCLRDEIPKEGYSMENLKNIYKMCKEKIPDWTPSIKTWVEELKEMGKFKE